VFFRAIEKAVLKAFSKDNRPILGANPAAACGNLHVAVTASALVCTDGDDIFINDGVYGGLMEYMQVPDLTALPRVRDGKVIEGEPNHGGFGPT
jgi:hypothetical protein